LLGRITPVPEVVVERQGFALSDDVGGEYEFPSNVSRIPSQNPYRR